MELITKDRDEIKKDMLDNIPDIYEKREGFITGDLVASGAIEIAKLHEAIAKVAKMLDVDNLYSEDLERFVYQRRGLSRKKGTYAKVNLTIWGNGNIAVGDIVSTSSGIQFTVMESKTIVGTGDVLAQCTETGSIGIVPAGAITQFPITIQGLTAVSNPSPSYDGFDDESDNDLRQRYYEDLQKPATSNNIYHFKLWAKEVVGIGDAKVIPTWNGKNTVKVIVIDSNKLPASSSLVDQVQEHIDPIDLDKWGRGYGKSAVGSYCTVEAATANSIDVVATIIKSSTYTLDQVKTRIMELLTNYFKEIAFASDYVSYSKITSLILSADGVIDASGILVNQSNSNVQLQDNQVPVLGTLDIE